MHTAHQRLLAGVLLAAFAAMGVHAAFAADTPKATQTILKALKLTDDAKITANLNEEATDAPAAIVEGAKKEKTLTISGSIRADEFQKIVAPFRERYPFLSVRYSSGDQNARNIKPLVAYQEGRVLYDIIEGLGVNLSQYRAAGALEKLTDIPNIKNIPADVRDPEQFWVAPRLRYWCMTYNTNTIKDSDLPKTWDDLLTDKRLFNGHLGVVNRPNDFMIMLWGAKGPEWSKNFMQKLFNVVQPQLRKEGSDAAVGLVAAGEFDVGMPLASYRTYQYVKRGAPLSWHCPEPVPLSFSAMVVVHKSPHVNAAKLYVNWFLSKEAQLAQFYADGSPPIHKELQDKRFVLYSDQIVGKKMAPRWPSLLEHDMKTVAELWNDAWQNAAPKK
ncbi:MAG TPA: extracellular solute-binding protein [Alphaproteobacteria bacterium]|nr:extracellular solute-binding protein [Alphaproteobacteria bacterium]